MSRQQCGLPLYLACQSLCPSLNQISNITIWTYDSAAPTSGNATIYCGAEIMSLEWDCKSDWTYDSVAPTSRNATIYCGAEILSLGFRNPKLQGSSSPSNGRGFSGFPIVNPMLPVSNTPVNPQGPTVNIQFSSGLVKSVRSFIVCDLYSTEAYPREGTGYFDKLGFSSLTVWNMRTWKAMSHEPSLLSNIFEEVLPLGKDPPAITSLSFNHNGKLLATAATDGNDSYVCSIRFGPDETSIFSLGTDGNASFFETLGYPLQFLHGAYELLAFIILNHYNEQKRKIPWSTNCSRFCNSENSSRRHEMALDVDGRRLLVTSNTKTAPIYQLSGIRTLSHGGSITTVDWHPTMPIFLMGSADHSVRVTSIL
ncbi:hypothetical protein CDL12_28462 [Handroanthus impetiginosus]|uniref:Uncharacterized protein n=1 Tax=Handroanthus impetiginosus TaxID=429701 RepID=A0A2G9G187_9LAMI|nr:hypothetical protein CDL12_28462 [Handroanthus impetiginosus]